jgi:hypothetical protein
MDLRQTLQPMIIELDIALEKFSKQAIIDGLKPHEHVYCWFLIQLETKIKRFVMDQERFTND